MRTNYVRGFYLPKHQPAPSTYVPHCESHLPPHCKEILQYCGCGRSLSEQSTCTFCQEAEVVLNCAKAMELDKEIPAILKPPQCATCQSRFPDSLTLQSHVKSHHALHNRVTRVERASMIHPPSMKVNELKEELKARGASLSGDKTTLIRRLEGLPSSEALRVFPKAFFN